MNFWMMYGTLTKAENKLATMENNILLEQIYSDTILILNFHFCKFKTSWHLTLITPPAKHILVFFWAGFFKCQLWAFAIQSR